LATLRQERLAVRRVAIAREKNDALTEGGIALLLHGEERTPIEFGHPQISENHVIGLRVKLSEGVTAIGRCLHPVSITAQELC